MADYPDFRYSGDILLESSRLGRYFGPKVCTTVRRRQVGLPSGNSGSSNAWSGDSRADCSVFPASGLGLGLPYPLRLLPAPSGTRSRSSATGHRNLLASHPAAIQPPRKPLTRAPGPKAGTKTHHAGIRRLVGLGPARRGERCVQRKRRGSGCAPSDWWWWGAARRAKSGSRAG
jgi:hypothetical protein